MKTKLITILIFVKQLIFFIGILTIVALIKLNLGHSYTINPDVFRSNKELYQERVLKEAIEMQRQQEIESYIQAQAEIKELKNKGSK